MWYTEDDEIVHYTFRGSTQLMHAAHLNNLPRVLQLIQLGAPLDLVDTTWGCSALHWASSFGHEHVAKALLDGKYEGRGATVNQLDKAYKWTSLCGACYNGHESTARLLLSRGAKQELQDNHGDTALHNAVLNGDHSGVVALLSAAPRAALALALKNRNGLTPLGLALVHHRAACEAVLRANAAPE
jgi:ankyrin repeat protein